MYKYGSVKSGRYRMTTPFPIGHRIKMNDRKLFSLLERAARNWPDDLPLSVAIRV
jgi:hypothetical protein